MKLFVDALKLKILWVAIFSAIGIMSYSQTVIYHTDFDNSPVAYKNETILNPKTSYNGWLTNDTTTQESEPQVYSGAYNNFRNAWAIVNDSTTLLDACAYESGGGCTTADIAPFYPIEKNSLSINAFFGTNGDSLLWEGYYLDIEQVALLGVHDYWTNLSTNRYAYRLTPSTNYSNITLKFQWKGVGVKNVAYGQVGYSTDAGKTWTWLATGGGAANNGQYYGVKTKNGQTVTVSLPSPACDNQANLAIGFNFVCTGAGGSDQDQYADFGPAFMIDNLTISGTPMAGCTAPTITAEANSSPAAYSVCPRGGVVVLSLTSNAAGGSGCSGNFDYSWYNGSMYWNGSAFASKTPVLDETYSSIEVTGTDTANYTVNVQCSLTPTCASSSSVKVIVLKDVSNLSAVVGNPANGASNHMTVSWGKIDGADYTLQFSKDNKTWTNTSFTGSGTSYDDNLGVYPNSPCFYQIQSYAGSISCGDWVPLLDTAYTACDFPVMTSSGSTANTVGLALGNDNNPSYTKYGIYCQTTGQWVENTGLLGGFAEFQTKEQWGAITVKGLIPATNYCFYAYARNQRGNLQTQGTTGEVCKSTGACVALSVSPPSVSSYTKCTGESITFSVSPEGTTPYSYQWLKGGIYVEALQSQR